MAKQKLTFEASMQRLDEIIKQLEKRKRRKNVPESVYLTEMRDPRNIVEFDDLHNVAVDLDCHAVSEITC